MFSSDRTTKLDGLSLNPGDEFTSFLPLISGVQDSSMKVAYVNQYSSLGDIVVVQFAYHHQHDLDRHQSNHCL